MLPLNNSLLNDNSYEVGVLNWFLKQELHERIEFLHVGIEFANEGKTVWSRGLLNSD